MKYLTYVFLAGLMTLVLACGVSTEDVDIEATIEARIASIPTPTPQIIIQEVEVSIAHRKLHI